MIETREPLAAKEQTAARIKDLIDKYYTDLDICFLSGVPLSELSLPQYFNFVKNIPYRRDKQPIEIIARPYHCIKYRDLGLDCKKKSILMGAFAKVNRIPYRFIGSSRRPDKKVHHIFPQVKIEGVWRNIDATYPQNKIFEQKTCTYSEEL